MAKTDGGYLMFGDDKRFVHIWQPKRPNFVQRLLWRLLGVGWRDVGYVGVLRVDWEASNIGINQPTD